MPIVVGANLITKVVLPEAVMGVEGMVVTLKSDALAPDMAILGKAPVKFKLVVPKF